MKLTATTLDPVEAAALRAMGWTIFGWRSGSEETYRWDVGARGWPPDPRNIYQKEGIHD